MSEQQQPKEYIITEEQLSQMEDEGTGDYGDSCVPTEVFVAIRSRPYPAPQQPVKFPNSTELLLMAHTDWKNRIERKHTHEEIPWVDGWIHGYLTPKPDFIRKQPPAAPGADAVLDDGKIHSAFEKFDQGIRGIDQMAWESGFRYGWEAVLRQQRGE